MGTGTWTPAVLTDFVDDLETLEIKWKGGTIKLDSTQIYDYLVIRRRSIDNSRRTDRNIVNQVDQKPITCY